MRGISLNFWFLACALQHHTHHTSDDDDELPHMYNKHYGWSKTYARIIVVTDLCISNQPNWMEFHEIYEIFNSLSPIHLLLAVLLCRWKWKSFCIWRLSVPAIGSCSLVSTYESVTGDTTIQYQQQVMRSSLNLHRLCVVVSYDFACTKSKVSILCRRSSQPVSHSNLNS